MDQTAIDLLVRFSRLAAEPGGRASVQQELARVAVERLGADAAAVLVVDGDVLRPAAHERLPARLAQAVVDADALGPQLGDEWLRAGGGGFSQAYSVLLAASGALFGALVILFRDTRALASDHVPLAMGLCDVAATALAVDAETARSRSAGAELRASQDAMVRTERLRSLGQMSAGITHDLKNILNPLSLHLQVLKRQLARRDLEDAERTVADLQRAVQRGVQTLERLRHFSKESPEGPPERCDLSALAQEAARIVAPRIAAVSVRPPKLVEELGTPPIVLARSADVIAAIVNLVANAIDVIPEGGVITIRTGERAGGGFVSVHDTGPGIPPEVAARIFTPFFTTKGAAGTGLGLAMVQACAQTHGGDVTLETASGQGTTFTMWLPAAPRS